jgi:hypothetical protein
MIARKQDQAATAAVERRQEPRITAHHPALLTTPHALPTEVWVLDVSPKGVKLRVPEPVAIGTAVKVEAQELLLFGTITHCELKDGAYCVGIALSRPLKVLAELGKLNAALLAEPESV